VTEEMTDKKVNEEIFYHSTPSMFRNRPFLFTFSLIAAVIGVIGLIMWMLADSADKALIVKSIVAIFVGAVGFGILFVWWLEVINTRLTVTNERITFRVGILSKKIHEVFLSDIRSVQISQDLLQRLLGTGHLEIASAASTDAEIKIDGIPKAYSVKEIIDDQRRKIQPVKSADTATDGE